MRCKRCGSDNLKPYTHRSPDKPREDQAVCFNGLVKADHICVAECSKPGTLCLNCRMLNEAQKETA